MFKMWRIIIQVIWGIFLLIGAIYDWKRKYISHYIFIIGCILTLISICIIQEWKIHLIGLVIGSIFILISKLTQQALGYGDSIICVLIGTGLGANQLIEYCTIGFLICSIICIIGVRLRIISTKSEIPFLPFLFCGYIVRWIFL